MLVFICSPYGGNPKNIALARRYMKMAAASWLIPLSLPVMLHGILDDHNPEQRNAGMAAGQEIMRLCGRMWICGDVTTDGMEADYQVWRARDWSGSARWVSMAELEKWEAGRD